MRPAFSGRSTLGFLSSWHVFEGGSAEPYSASLMKGVRTAAADFGCRLLLACGIGPIASEHRGAPAWPLISEAGTGFVPVGPWSTDGLIVLPSELTQEQSAYLQQLSESGFPVVFAGPDEAGPSVMIDNMGGIHEVVAHVVAHGCRQIAFISGLRRDTGDSAQRLNAFHQALAKLGIPVDPRSIAAGEHSFQGGQRAMRQILAAGVPFQAVVASNDRSAMGAISVLQENGYAVPEDVIVTGFDDMAEAKAWSPALTTLRNSSYAIGYQSTVRLLEFIEKRASTGADILIPAPLIRRQSCGCREFAHQLPAARFAVGEAMLSAGMLASLMTEAVQREVLYTSRSTVSLLCRSLAASFVEAAERRAPEPFLKKLDGVLDATDEQGDDLLAWNSAVSVLRGQAAGQGGFVEDLLDRARLAISDRARSVFAREQFEKEEASARLNLMMVELLAALDEGQVRRILDQHIGGLGIHRMLVAFFQPDEDDPAARSRVFYAYGFPAPLDGTVFETRRFPQAGWFPEAEPFQLALAPIVVLERVRGFVMFEAAQQDMLALIVRNLEAALRVTYFYEDALHGRRMAEDADRMKSRFLSMVSHELRTPLNVIAGLSEMLVRQQEPPVPAGLSQDLERIYANAQHLGRLIGDVLDLVSSESGHMRLEREPLDLASVFRPVAATGEQMARAKGLEWLADLPERGPYVLGDRTRLRQALLNLISNAVKFTYFGSVCLEMKQRDGEVVVSVRDTGIGIPTAEQPKLFTEFAQSERSIRRGIGGIGLGLAITKELVERQGGSIWFQSAGVEGCGSTFSFRLPPIAMPEEPQPAEAPPGNLTFLLVDDDPAIRYMHKRLLEEQMPCCRVLEAENGRAALECLRQHLPDLILLDLIMPEMDGYETLEALRRNEAARDIPVIVLTSKMLTEEDMARLNDGVAAVLSKGIFRGNEIAEHVEHALEKANGHASTSQRLVRRAVAYIQENSSGALSRDQIAEHLHINPDHLTDCFHKEMGITPMAYLNRCRLAQARKLLEQGGRTITQVALEVGFADCAHFSRVFQKEMGMSPRAYQKSRLR